MGDDPTKPKKKKKVSAGFDFASTFNQSLNGSGNGVATPEQPKPKNGFDFSQTFQQSLKKKDGGGESTTTLPQSESETPSTESNNGNAGSKVGQSAATLSLSTSNTNPSRGTSLFDNPQLNPFTKDAGTTVDINGAKLPIVNPTPLGNDAVDGIVKRIVSKTNLPNDIQNLAAATDKPVNAIQAYADNNKPLGYAIEAKDKQVKDTDKLIEGIKKVSSLTGLNIDPNAVLSSADNSTELLNNAKNFLQQETNNLQKNKDEQSQQKMSDIAVYGGTANKEKLLNEKSQPIADYVPPIDVATLNDYTKVLTNHVINKTVEEDFNNAVPKEQTINKIFQRLDPQGYSQNQKAVKSIGSEGGLLSGLGNFYDAVSGNEDKKMDLLNSQKGIAEQYYNQSLENLGIQKKSDGIINNNPELTKQGDNILSQVDRNVTDKYPSLIKAEMVRRVNDAIARESGVVKGIDAEPGHVGEKIIGASLPDYYRHLKEMGYLDDAKTKDLAMNLLSHPSYFSDNSILGSVGESFLQPFKELGMSIGDITGFRNSSDILSDKIKEELYPSDLESTPNADLKLKSGVRIARTILNTTANLTGMMAIATVTEGIGTEAGISQKVAKGLGAYTSFGLPSFDASLKDSKNFIDSEPAQYLYATINAVANAEGGRLLDLGKITRIPGISDEFAKLAKGLSDKTISEEVAKELLGDNFINKYVDFAVKYGKNVTKGAATMAAFSIKDNVLKATFGDPNAAANILPQAGHAFLDGVLGMSILGGFGAAADLRNDKNSTYKGTIYNMALNPDAAKDVFTIALKNGEITKPEYDSKIQILNTSVAAKNALDVTEQETNINLTQDQKAVYVANKTAQGVLKKQSEQSGITEESKNKYLAQSDRLAEQSNQILDGLKFTPTLEPIYDLFEAEKNFNEAQDNFNPADAKSEKDLLAAKEVYDKLYSNYLENNSSPLIIKNEKRNSQEGGSQESNVQTGNEQNGQDAGQENVQKEVLNPAMGAVDETAPTLKEKGLLEQAKNLVNNDAVKGYTSEVMKDAAENNPEQFKQFLSDVAEQAHDENSVKATVETYGEQLVNIAKELFPNKEVPIEKPKVTVIQPSENKPPNIVEPKQNIEEVKKIEEERDNKINEIGKPDIKLELISAKDLVNSKDPIENKKKHDAIKETYKKLRNVIECL